MKRIFATVMSAALLLIACAGCTTVKVVSETTKPSASAAPAASTAPQTSATPKASTAPQTSTAPKSSSTAAAGKYKPGTYEVTTKGMGGNFKVIVTFDANSIVSITAPDNKETENIGTRAIEVVIPAMIKAQSTEVDSYSGATITSEALKKALTKAIEMAKP